MAEYNTSDIVNVAKNTVSKWEKPGGTTGMIVLGVVVGAIAINITPIMNLLQQHAQAHYLQLVWQQHFF